LNFTNSFDLRVNLISAAMMIVICATFFISSFMCRSGGIPVKNEFVIILTALALIQSAYGIQVTASGGSYGESGSVTMNFDTLKSTAVNSQIAISGATISPSTAIAGPIPRFEWTHGVTDASGKCARVYVKVLNAPLGLTYSSRVLPKEGSVATQSQVSAEQWLTVPKADSIQCTATSTYGIVRSANVGLGECKGTLAVDYVTLSGYYGKAVTTGTSVLASQTATSGAANSINIYGGAKDGSESYNINTPLKDISGGKAAFVGLSETSSAGATTQVVQMEHLYGTFTSTATNTPMTGTPKTATRTSNYGSEYDLNMKAAKGSSPTGNLGYYVKPGTTASKIQGAVNAAQSGDTINVASGTYKENVKIDKSLTVKGAGSTKTIFDGNRAGSVFDIGYNNPKVSVTLSDMTVQGGSGKSITTKYGSIGVCGGGVLNYGMLTVTRSTISENIAGFLGGGIYNVGTLAVLDSTLSKNIASWGGGVYNYGLATVTGSNVLGNAAINSGGGFYSCCSSITTVIGSKISGNTANGLGGGIAAQGILTVRGSSIISGNTAKSGGGIGWQNRRPIIDPTTVVTGNSNPQIYPYL
jgi:hypothetical protein